MEVYARTEKCSNRPKYVDKLYRVPLGVYSGTSAEMNAFMNFFECVVQSYKFIHDVLFSNIY